MKPSLVSLLLVLHILASYGFAQIPVPTVEADGADRLGKLESRVTELEKRLDPLLFPKPETPRKTDPSPIPSAGAVAFLFGGFCALWAQNTGRNPWLWFFLGLIGSVIAVIAVLTKNGDDRFDRQQRERYTGKPT